MSEDSVIDRFAKDPSLLVDLCRDVIEQLDAGSEDVTVADQEAQLRAIAKAADQLEKSGVAVPEPLRAETTRLAAALAVRTDSKQALAQLADEFRDILKDVRARLGQTPAAPETKPRGKHAATDPARTPRSTLREHLISALRNLGGRASKRDVLAEMGRLLDGQLLAGDMVWLTSNSCYSWQRAAAKERDELAKVGIIGNHSPAGILELSEVQQ